MLNSGKTKNNHPISTAFRTSNGRYTTTPYSRFTKATPLPQISVVNIIKQLSKLLPQEYSKDPSTKYGNTMPAIIQSK